MKHKLKHLIALLISLLPSSLLRRTAYQIVLKYQFGPGTRIGHLAVIAVDSFCCGERTTIGRGSRFIGPIRVTIGDQTVIGRWNHFECPAIAASPARSHMGYARRLELGERCLVHEKHYFDLYGAIHIGAGTWIAGRDTQFWTHGAGVADRDIVLGSGCYVGSAARFAPGSGLGNRVIAGLGTVVTRRIEESDVVIGGVPAGIIRKRDSNDTLRFEQIEEAR